MWSEEYSKLTTYEKEEFRRIANYLYLIPIWSGLHTMQARK